MIIISGILSYSGISAKARAMGGKLLKKEQYEQLASCASVGEAVGYLRQFSEYEPLLRDFDEHDSHRGMIEATLMGSLYNDYNRLYSFARGEQKPLTYSTIITELEKVWAIIKQEDTTLIDPYGYDVRINH